MVCVCYLTPVESANVRLMAKCSLQTSRSGVCVLWSLCLSENQLNDAVLHRTEAHAFISPLSIFPLRGVQIQLVALEDRYWVILLSL